MQTNSEEKSPAVEFRAKHHSPDRADPETAKKALDELRTLLDIDPMAIVWDEKLNDIQKHGLWLVAGLRGAEDGEYHKKWFRVTSSQKQRLIKTISTFAGLSTRIKGAL